MIDELYDSLYQELTGWCTAMAGSRTQAEDLVQEAFLRAMLNAGLLEELDAGKRRAWMYRTVKNLYIDRKRREAFETMVEQMPEEGIEDAEYAQVDDAQLLAVLTPEERMLFTLRYLEGYNSAELGKNLRPAFRHGEIQTVGCQKSPAAVAGGDRRSGETKRRQKERPEKPDLKKAKRKGQVLTCQRRKNLS